MLDETKGGGKVRDHVLWKIECVKIVKDAQYLRSEEAIQCEKGKKE